MNVPASLLPIFHACHKAGGRALLVGGCVRDFLMQQPSKDFDIEVHGLEINQLLRSLRPFGHINEVGKSFGVLKLRLGSQELDISVPRIDARQGPGHRGIQATAAPFIGTTEAARRRDLTINAIAYDPVNQEYVDPFGGQQDLSARCLRAVDAQTFGEDPLRALRAAQFAARFEFDVHPSLEELCRQMPLEELPSERIHGEVDKLLMKGKRPSIGWELAWRTGMWTRVLPAWKACPPRLDAIATQTRTLDSHRRRALLMAMACSNNTVAETLDILDRLRLFKWEGYRLREQVLFLVSHLATRNPDDPQLRRMADLGELELLSIAQENPALADSARRLGILNQPLPPLIQGRDLALMGMPPGPNMGRILAVIREEQLSGTLTEPEQAHARARALIEAG